MLRQAEIHGIDDLRVGNIIIQIRQRMQNNIKRFSSVMNFKSLYVFQKYGLRSFPAYNFGNIEK